VPGISTLIYVFYNVSLAEWNTALLWYIFLIYVTLKGVTGNLNCTVEAADFMHV